MAPNFFQLLTTNSFDYGTPKQGMLINFCCFWYFLTSRSFPRQVVSTFTTGKVAYKYVFIFIFTHSIRITTLQQSLAIFRHIFILSCVWIVNPLSQYHHLPAEWERFLDSNVSSTRFTLTEHRNSTFFMARRCCIPQAQQKNLSMGRACQRSHDGVRRALRTSKYCDTHRWGQVCSRIRVNGPNLTHEQAAGHNIGRQKNVRHTQNYSLISAQLIFFLFAKGTYGNSAFLLSWSTSANHLCTGLSLLSVFVFC